MLPLLEQDISLTAPGQPCSFVPLLSAAEGAGGGVDVFHSLLQSRKGL